MNKKEYVRRRKLVLYSAMISSFISSLSFSIATLLVMRVPIANLVNGFNAGVIDRASYLLTSDAFKYLQRIFSAHNLFDLKNSISFRQASSLNSIISAPEGIKILEAILLNSELRDKFKGILSINPDGIKIIQNILAHDVTLNTLRTLFRDKDKIAALTKILSSDTGKKLLMDLLSGAKDTTDVGIILLKKTQLRKAFNSALASGNIAALKNILLNESAIAALQDILKSSDELKGLNGILSASSANLEQLKALLNAQALQQIQPAINVSAYIGLALAASMVIGVIIFGITGLLTNRNKEEMDAGNKVEPRYLIGNITCGALLGASTIASTLFVIMEMKKFTKIFSPKVMQSHVNIVTLGCMIAALTLAVLAAIGVQKLCHDQDQKSLTQEEGSPRTRSDDPAYAQFQRELV